MLASDIKETPPFCLVSLSHVHCRVKDEQFAIVLFGWASLCMQARVARQLSSSLQAWCSSTQQVAWSEWPCKHTNARGSFQKQTTLHSFKLVHQRALHKVPLQPEIQVEERAWKSFKRAVRSCIAVRSPSSVWTCFSSTSLSCCLVDGKNSLMTDAVLLALEKIAGPVPTGSAAELAGTCNWSDALFYKMCASKFDLTRMHVIGWNSPSSAAFADVDASATRNTSANASAW